MKIAYSSYELKANGGKVRTGALLQVDLDGKRGYADLHPWPELGDLSLSEQLALLSKGRLTSLTEQSLRFAETDARARSQKLSLFLSLEIPPSHRLLSSLDEKIPEGFSLVKVKLGYDFINELSRLPDFLNQLPAECEARFDFNNRIDQSEFSRYLPILERWRQKVDYIEDPFAFDAQRWEEVQNTTGLRLALDRNAELHTDSKRSYGVTVIKPAIQEVARLSSIVPHQVVITSYLDHPVGQATAAYSAALMGQNSPEKLLPCGLLSHTYYQTNKYSERLRIVGNRLQLPKDGTGFGFDDLLSQEKWNDLS